MSDLDVQKCRGPTLSKADNSLVCPAQPESISSTFFNNFNDEPNNWLIQDFIDGTMINLFKFNDETYLSTRSCLNARCRWFANKHLPIYLHNVCSSPEKLDSLDMNYCYSFVIQHPITIVKKYLVPDLTIE